MSDLKKAQREIERQAEELARLVRDLPPAHRRMMARVVSDIVRESAHVEEEITPPPDEGSDNFAPFGMVLIVCGGLFWIIFPLIGQLCVVLGVAIVLLSVIAARLSGSGQGEGGE